VLKENGIVDDLTVKAIRLQFAHITRHDTSTNDNKVLDDKIVFLEMKAQGRIMQAKAGGPPMTPRGRKIEYVDMKAEDGGFQEWREVYWWPRVFSGKVGMFDQVRMAPVKQSSVDGAKYKQLEEGKPSKADRPPTDHHGVSAEKTKPGGYFSDGTAIADGEYVWMPYEQARRHRGGKGTSDQDMMLWWVLAIFLGYFILKMVPTIISYHTGSGAPEEDARRRLLSSELSALAAAKVGDNLTAEMMAQLSQVLTAHR